MNAGVTTISSPSRIISLPSPSCLGSVSSTYFISSPSNPINRFLFSSTPSNNTFDFINFIVFDMKLLPLDLCLGQVYDTAQLLESANGSRVRLTKIMFDGYLSHTTTFNRKGADRIS